MNVQIYLRDLFGLFYPNLCLACGRQLTRGEEHICTYCFFHLPKTWFHNDAENPVFRSFWGRVDVEMAAAYLFFNKGNQVQKLMHSLKYKGDKELGIYLGRLYGVELSQSDHYSGVDVIIPVPLHHKKLRQRGYNQSEMIGIGLAKSLNVEMNPNILKRAASTQTQTRKNRFQRWQNVESSFMVKKKEMAVDKHLLLVDDVVTTGATLEACASSLLAIEGVKVSCCAIAWAL
jgi:ComF family protein